MMRSKNDLLIVNKNQSRTRWFIISVYDGTKKKKAFYFVYQKHILLI
jgi:hypothetical protein